MSAKKKKLAIPRAKFKLAPKSSALLRSRKCSSDTVVFPLSPPLLASVRGLNGWKERAGKGWERKEPHAAGGTGHGWASQDNTLLGQACLGVCTQGGAGRREGAVLGGMGARRQEPAPAAEHWGVSRLRAGGRSPAAEQCCVTEAESSLSLIDKALGWNGDRRNQ